MKKIIRLTESDLTRIVKQVIREFDYEEHRHPEIDIIERVVVTFNPGSREVVEVEGILGESKNQEMLYFKPLIEPKIFESSDPLNLETDNEISLDESHTHTQRAVETLVNNIGNWMGVSFQGERFNLDIDFGKVLNRDGFGMNFIGNWNCIFKSIKFDKI
jgi:hypothetical protein